MNRSDKFKEIRDIADAICHEEVTPEQVQDLERFLKDNPEGQKFYYEYIGMHIHMQGAIEPNMEVVRRKMQVEEVIVRPAGSGDNGGDNGNYNPPFNTTQTANPPPALASDEQTKPTKPSSRISVVLVGIILLVASFVLFYLIQGASTPFLAEVTKGQVSVEKFGKLDSRLLHAGRYKADSQAEIKLSTGEQLKLEKGSILVIYHNKQIGLAHGRLQITPINKHNLVIRHTNFLLHTNASHMSISQKGQYTQLTSSDKTKLFPVRWRPQHFWSFENKTSNVALDLAGSAHGVPSKGASRTKGLLGSGAFTFDGSKKARLNVGSGGGTAPATGSFAVTDGITIEALIMPKFSGKRGDQDVIFRKDQTDNNLRLLLGFQNDQYKTYLKPEGTFKESLSFGLFILGQGYHELKLPLDGLNGRPTLAQLKTGKAHHIVATYSVKTGVKAIYIDGIQHAFYQYPPGSRVISGGSGLANIGNTPNNIDSGLNQPQVAGETFKGVIDEVAFYNFALSEWMVQQHHQNVRRGLNYFGHEPNADTLPDRAGIMLPANSQITLDPQTGLPIKIKNSAGEKQ